MSSADPRVRLHSNRVFYATPEEVDPRPVGRPRRHGRKFDLKDPASWPEPTCEHRCESDDYGPVRVRCWAGLHPKTRRIGERYGCERAPVVRGCVVLVEVGKLPRAVCIEDAPAVGRSRSARRSHMHPPHRPPRAPDASPRREHPASWPTRLPQRVLYLREGLLYGVVVRRVGWQEHDAGSPFLDQLSHPRTPMHREVVHHHDLSVRAVALGTDSRAPSDKARRTPAQRSPRCSTTARSPPRA